MSASDSDQLVNSGWTGRYLHEVYPDYPELFPNDDMPDPLAIEIGFGSSLLFQGPTAAMSMVINDSSSFYDLLEDVDKDVPDTQAGDKLGHVQLMARQSQQYGEVVKAAAEKVTSQGEYPETYLAIQLKIVFWRVPNQCIVFNSQTMGFNS